MAGNESAVQSSTSTDTLSIAGWHIHAPTNRISKGEKTVRLEPRTMGVLVELASHPGEVVKREQLEQVVWPRMVVGYDALSNTIKKLRKAFDDDPKDPRIIETIPKVGYRLIGEVSHAPSDTREQAAPATAKLPKRKLVAGAAALVVLVVAIVIAAWIVPRQPSEQEALPLSDRLSIAVLPFANLSGDKEQEYFSDGLGDDLITALSRISGLLVIARNSSFAYKNKAVDVRIVARELGVKYVLEGSTRRLGQQVRVNAQLIDAGTGGHLWAEQYDDKMANIFTLQDRITRKIVAALAVELTAEEKGRVYRRDTDNVDAYDAFLLGWEHYLRRTPEDLAKAISHLNRAVALDPDFARAHAALAEVYQKSIARGWWRTQGIERWEAREKMHEHLAIAERETMPIAYQVKARTLVRARRHDEAIAKLEEALVRNPNHFLLHITMAWALSFSGHPEKAVAYAQKAKRLDPRQQAQALWQLGLAQFGMEHFEAAVNSFDRAIKLNPKAAQWPLMAAYGQLGRTQKAADTRKAYFKLRGWEGTHNVSTMLNFYPYKHEVDEKRFANGLLAAGVPGYYEVSETNKLTGVQIRALLFDRVRTGFDLLSGKQFWITYAEDGKVARRGGRQGSDTGEAWIDGDSLCHKWQKVRKGREQCVPVYRNPRGSRDALDEYFLIDGPYVIPWSVVD